METSRSSFLKGAVGTAAVAAAATLSIPAEAAKAPKKWDVTTDVVVIGFGGAGATTAISAAQNGANVVVLEKKRVCNFLWAARSRLIDVGGDSVTK